MIFVGNVTVQVARKCLEDLIRRAAEGEEIIIVRGKTPVARLPAPASKPANAASVPTVASSRCRHPSSIRCRMPILALPRPITRDPRMSSKVRPAAGDEKS
jgi:antitoxin (DNA-binding transcriptional repressor) of toxin-antitoxin stability system